MNKLISVTLLLFIFAVQFCFSQETKMEKDTITLKEVVIKKRPSRKEMKLIIEKIKQNLRENYETEYVNYFTNHFSLHDRTDTLVNRKMVNSLKIKSLDNENITWMLTGDPSNPFHRDISPYLDYEPFEKQGNWLALSIFYDSLKVIDFDFFDMTKNYKYDISKVDNITTVKFTASRYYSGYFSFNNVNYNLIRIAFKNTKPYDYYVYGYINNSLEFKSQWSYNKVTVLLDFEETDKGRLLLNKLDAMQELIKFMSTRYNYSREIIARDFNSRFYTTLSMRILD